MNGTPTLSALATVQERIDIGLTERAAVNGFTDIRPAEGGRQQFNAKIESLTCWRFRRACSARGESYASVVERLMDVYTAQAEGTHVLHMDGNECPLSKLITGIAEEARGDDVAMTSTETLARKLFNLRKAYLLKRHPAMSTIRWDDAAASEREAWLVLAMWTEAHYTPRVPR